MSKLLLMPLVVIHTEVAISNYDVSGSLDMRVLDS
jgi:hypothetical protein